MKIIISGQACASDGRTGEAITDTPVLQSLQGLRYDGDLCANHLYHDLLHDVSITGGAIEMAFDAERGGLQVVSEYWSPAALQPDQLQVLVEQTIGQWSDGLGEGCFYEWSQQSGIDLNLAPFHLDGYETAVAEQVEDGREAPRFAHLAKAVWKGRFDVVQQAVAEQADLNAIYDGHTALHLAILRNNAQIALLLIEGGADVNRANPLGATPLMACVLLESPADAVAVARALLAAGANAEARDMGDTTALEIARERERTELVALLTK